MPVSALLSRLSSRFGPSVTDQQAHALHHALTGLARAPVFYQAPYNIPDTLDGRFDWLSLLVGTACLRLSDGPNGEGLSQTVFDIMFKHIERNLREAGIGDLSVPKQMRRMIQAFYGRNSHYAEALLQSDPVERITRLTSVIAVNIYNRPDADEAPNLSAWVTQNWWPIFDRNLKEIDVKDLIEKIESLH